MKNFQITLVFMLIWSGAVAQQYKYKELVVLLDKSSSFGQLAMLKDHIIKDADQPNADFRIGLLHYSIFRKNDPLIEFESAMAHANQAHFWLNKSKTTVTESEVKRENDYYAPIFGTFDSKGRPSVQYPVVQKKLNDAFDSVSMFKSKMPAIYHAFTKSVNHYGKAVSLFANINNKYKSLEDLLFLFDDRIDGDFSKMKTAFDSSVFYFKKYNELLVEYPLASYNQQYKIRPIQLYRLDGLTTRLNFLTDEVVLWDYSSWIDHVRTMHAKEIVPLKEKLDQNEARINKVLAEINSNSSPEIQKIDKDLVFNLNNLDKNSLPLALLNYKSFKQTYLAKANRIGKDTAIDSKLELYSALIQQNRTADSLLAIVKKQMRPLSLSKHEQYLNKFYNGAKGVAAFVSTEEQAIASGFRQYQSSIKENLRFYTASSDTLKRYIKISNMNVPLFVERVKVADVAPGASYTFKVLQNPDGSKYLAGVQKINKKIQNAMVFVARINPDGRTGWVKEYNLSPDSLTTEFDNFFGDIVSTQEGCGVIVTSATPGKDVIANHFVFLNDKGEEKIFKLKENKMARKILYQERSNTFTFLFKGEQEQQTIQVDEQATLTSINILGDLNWRRALTFSGTVEDIVSVRDGYILVGNYTAMRDASGKDLKTKAAVGQANPYLIKLSLTGEVLKMLPMVSPRSIYVDSVVKVNDESINLLGREIPFTAKQDQSAGQDKTLHMMTSYTLRQFCSDF